MPAKMAGVKWIQNVAWRPPTNVRVQTVLAPAWGRRPREGTMVVDGDASNGESSRVRTPRRHDLNTPIPTGWKLTACCHVQLPLDMIGDDLLQ